MLTKDEIFNYFTTEIVEKYNFTTSGIAMIVAQCDHETMGFTRMRENFNYSYEGLLETFPKYFDAITARTYAGRAINIANHVYANRMGNFGESSDDGWKYRGGGWIMITGRRMCFLCGKNLNIDLISNPELLETLPYSFLSALWYFDYKNIINKTNCEMVTLAINGGYNGLEERQDLYNKYLEILK